MVCLFKCPGSELMKTLPLACAGLNPLNRLWGPCPAAPLAPPQDLPAVSSPGNRSNGAGPLPPAQLHGAASQVGARTLQLVPGSGQTQYLSCFLVLEVAGSGPVHSSLAAEPSDCSERKFTLHFGCTVKRKPEVELLADDNATALCFVLPKPKSKARLACCAQIAALRRQRGTSPAFPYSPRFFSSVVDRNCKLFPKMPHHEERGTSFCSHSGLLVPYHVAGGSISQISVTVILKLQYTPVSICVRC